MRQEINDFYQLETWKEAHRLVLKIYLTTKSFPKEEKYGIINQLRRATASITANIAEGFGRFHFADKTRFYHQARGSVKETQNFILLARDLGYISKHSAKQLWQQTKTCEKLTNGLIRSLKNQQQAGKK